MKNNEEKLKINEIKDTPFKIVETNNGKYLTCGKIVLEVKNDEEAKNMIVKKDWDAIALLAQAIAYEIINENLKNKK